MQKINYQELANLSPFELKNTLIKMASGSEKVMLNAGRGNPNFLATLPREGLFQFGLFALEESENAFSFLPEGVGGFPRHEGIEARFDNFVQKHSDKRGVQFIRRAVSFVRDQLGYPAADFIYEMCEAILGCNYPVPDRMLTLSEKIVGRYIRQEMIGQYPFTRDFDLFAVEGGTAAITYIFNSLRENHILMPGDHLALGLPIFTPYIEIPQLNDYRLVNVNIDADEKQNWQFPASELDKLLDPKVKAFFLVNPSNPPSVKMSDENLKHMARIVEKRPDLLILTDDVYGTFADSFTSLFAVCPRNTLLVYSYSKYFGATGWRMGVIGLTRDNIIDEMISKHPEAVRKELEVRYGSITVDPNNLKFIDRMVADSRAVALNHTAGLATPVQAQMVLFSLFSMMDFDESYKSAMKKLIRKRTEMLYSGFGGTPPVDPNAVDYYQLIDVEEIYRKEYGDGFVKWYLDTLQPNEALFRLAEEAGVVLLPAEGFGATHPSFRVSLANLSEVDYVKIGQAIHTIGVEYYSRFQKESKK